MAEIYTDHGALLERLQLSQLALGTVVPLGDPYLPAAASASACCGQWSLCCGLLCLLCVSGPIILRRSLYRATANYDMGYPLYCENELPVTLLTLKLVLLGGRALQIFYVGGAAPFGGPSYFPPKVRLLVLPLHAPTLYELTCTILACTHTRAEISKLS